MGLALSACPGKSMVALIELPASVVGINIVAAGSLAARLVKPLVTFAVVGVVAAGSGSSG